MYSSRDELERGNNGRFSRFQICELVPKFCCDNSVAILHSDWFHGASDFSHYRGHEHYLEHRRSLPVTRLLVMRMSRKHNVHAFFFFFFFFFLLIILYAIIICKGHTIATNANTGVYPS